MSFTIILLIYEQRLRQQTSWQFFLFLCIMYSFERFNCSVFTCAYEVRAKAHSTALCVIVLSCAQFSTLPVRSAHEELLSSQLSLGNMSAPIEGKNGEFTQDSQDVITLSSCRYTCNPFVLRPSVMQYSVSCHKFSQRHKKDLC